MFTFITLSIHSDFVPKYLPTYLPMGIHTFQSLIRFSEGHLGEGEKKYLSSARSCMYVYVCVYTIPIID